MTDRQLVALMAAIMLAESRSAETERYVEKAVEILKVTEKHTEKQLHDQFAGEHTQESNA